MIGFKHFFFALIGTLSFYLSATQIAKAQTIDSNQKQVNFVSVSNDPLEVKQYTLSNGLKVFLSVNKRAPRVQCMVAVRTGSKNDPADNTGLAHYLEHMLFKGTAAYGTKNYDAEKIYLDRIETLFEGHKNSTDSALRAQLYGRIDSISYRASQTAIANEYDKMMQLLGAEGTNAYTSFDQTVYLSSIPSNQLLKFLKIEAERFRNPVFRLFHTELEAVYEEKNRSLDDDNSKMFEKLLYGTFPGHPYGTQTTIGTVEHLKSPSIKAIREYYKKYYIPNNMAIILAGDFDPEEIIAEIEKQFAYMYPRELVQTPAPKAPLRNEKFVDTVFGPDAEYVAFAYRMPSGRQIEALYLDMINNILFNGNAGIMDVNLLNNQKVQYAYAFPLMMNDASAHLFIGNPKPGQSLDEVKSLIIEQIEKLKRGEFSEEMMKAILDNMEVAEMQELRSNYVRANEMLNAFVAGFEWPTYFNYKEMRKKISKQDLVDFANKYYTNEVTVFKKEGKDTTVQKILKPNITPIELNKGVESAFLKKTAYANVEPVKPVFIDYEKDIDSVMLRGDFPMFYVKNKTDKLFRLYYILDMGRLHDLKLAHAINLLPYLGTDKYTVNELKRKFYELACEYGVSAGEDRIYVYLSGLDKNFDEAFALFEHLIRNAKADQQALNDLNERTIKARENEKKDKGTILFAAMQAYAMYGKDNPFTYRLTEKELRSLDANVLTASLHKLFDYKHTAFYYGPREKAAMAEFLKSQHTLAATLADYPKIKTFKYAKAPKKNTVLFTHFDMVQAEVLWLRNSGAYNPKETTVSSVFNEYFDGGMGTVVFQELRESKALAYSTYARFTTPSEPNKPHFVMAYIGSQADKFNDAVPAMNKLFNTPPTNEKALRNAITSKKQGIETQRILDESIYFNYLTAKRMGRNFDIRKQIYDEIENVTLSNLSAFQQNYFADKAFSYCVIASEDKVAKADLKKLGKLKIISIEELFGEKKK